MNKDALEKKYMKPIKICAKLTGIWPDQNDLSKYVMRVITYILVVPCIATQVARVVLFFSIDVMIEQLSFLGAALGILLKQGNYIVKTAEYETFINCIRRDWSVNRPKKEHDIMIKYAERGALFTSFYVANGYCCFTLFFQVLVTPHVLDIIMPKNESREVGYIFPAYYPFDQHKYYSLIIAHMVSVMIVVFYVYVACDASYMYIVQHGCGLLAMAGYHFKEAIQELHTVKEKHTMRDDFYRSVCCAIREHQYAIKFLRIIEDSHVTYLFICIGFVMVCFSVTLVKAAQNEESWEFTTDLTFIVIQLIHIFNLTIQGQLVLDANDEIADSIYDALWYASDKRTQMLFALALRNCLIPPRLTAGGLITLNLQSFSEIIKASVSYFTVLKTT